MPSIVTKRPYRKNKYEREQKRLNLERKLLEHTKTKGECKQELWPQKRRAKEYFLIILYEDKKDTHTLGTKERKTINRAITKKG